MIGPSASGSGRFLPLAEGRAWLSAHIPRWFLHFRYAPLLALLSVGSGYAIAGLVLLGGPAPGLYAERSSHLLPRMASVALYPFIESLLLWGLVTVLMRLSGSLRWAVFGTALIAAALHYMNAVLAPLLVLIPFVILSLPFLFGGVQPRSAMLSMTIHACHNFYVAVIDSILG